MRGSYGIWHAHQPPTQPYYAAQRDILFRLLPVSSCELGQTFLNPDSPNLTYLFEGENNTKDENSRNGGITAKNEKSTA